MDKTRLIKTLIVFINFSIILLLIFLSVLIFFTILKPYKDEYKESSEIIEILEEKYRHLEYNPRTNRTSTGLITIVKPLENDFLSYQTSEGNYALISNFGTNEYRCTGLCYCENSDGERRITQTLQTSLIYLVAAASSLLAYTLAKEHLKKECAVHFEDSCPYTSLTLEEDGCEDIFGRSQEGVIYDEDGSIAKEIEEGMHNPMEFVNFLCDGHCLTKKFDEEEPEFSFSNEEVLFFSDWAQEVANDYGCEDMKMEQIVDFLDDGEDIISQEDKARRIFTHTYLSLFCQDNTNVRFFDLEKKFVKLTIDQIGDKDDHTTSVCLGYQRSDFKNPEVYCRKTSKEAEDPFDDIEMHGAGGLYE